jgi:hypothetical protein
MSAALDTQAIPVEAGASVPNVEYAPQTAPNPAIAPAPSEVQDHSVLEVSDSEMAAAVAALVTRIGSIAVNSEQCVRLLEVTSKQQTTRIGQLEKDYSAVKQSLDRASTDLRNAVQDSAELRQANAEAQGRIDAAEGSMQGALARVDTLQGDLTLLSTAIFPTGTGEFWTQVVRNLPPDIAARVLYHLHSIAHQLRASDASSTSLVEALHCLGQALHEVWHEKPDKLEEMRQQVNRMLEGRLSARGIVPGDLIDESFMTGPNMQGCRKVGAVKAWALLQGDRIVRKADIVPTR